MRTYQSLSCLRMQKYKPSDSESFNLETQMSLEPGVITITCHSPSLVGSGGSGLVMTGVGWGRRAVG
jgi:hypothetical protein